MTELDLVPTRYRERLQTRARIGWALVATCALLLLGGVSRVGLSVGIEAEQQRIQTLREAEAQAINRRNQLETLRAREAELRSRLEILQGLRGGASARQMMTTVDAALGGPVWFRTWTFRRAGQLVEKEPENLRAGYFVVVPRTNENEPERAWRLDTHMEIEAQTYSHAALAEFARKLVQQDDIDDVRVLNTNARGEDAIVEFELAVVVGAGA